MNDISFARRNFLAVSSSLVASVWLPCESHAQEKSTVTNADAKQFESTVAKAIDFLRVKGQAADGSFSKQVGIGVTSLAATGLLRHGRSPDDPVVASALKFILENVQPTGGIHLPNGRLMTYETCVAVVCLEAANRDHRYDETLKRADKFLKEMPFDAA